MMTKAKAGINQNIKLLINHIKIYTEYYFAVTAALGIIWGAFVVYDKWRDDNNRMQKDVTTIIATQKIQTRTDSILLENQKDMEAKLDKIENVTSSLQSSYVKYISNDKTLTKQDFLKYMEGLSYDVKKNSSLLNKGEQLQNPLIMSSK